MLISHFTETSVELSVLRSHVANLQEEISMKNLEVSTLEEQLKDLAMIKTSQDVERMRLQTMLDSLSGYLKGLKTNLRYKKPC